MNCIWDHISFNAGTMKFIERRLYLSSGEGSIPDILNEALKTVLTYIFLSPIFSLFSMFCYFYQLFFGYFCQNLYIYILPCPTGKFCSACLWIRCHWFWSYSFSDFWYLENDREVPVTAMLFEFEGPASLW